MAGLPDGDIGKRRFNSLGTANMFTTGPTWTTERVERLKSHFEAGLSCREIAADIGVSRNAVIGKLSRLGLTRGVFQAEPRPDKRRARRSEVDSPAAVSDAAIGLRGRRTRPRRRRRQRAPLLAVRTLRATMPLADQHARRRRFLLLRQHAARRRALLRRAHPPRLPPRLTPARRARG